MAIESGHRFSSRVDDYRRYRPHYPVEILSAMKRRGMNSESVVADIGSGTGLFTGLILPAVRRVYAIEPNDDMRKISEGDFSGMAQFTSVACGAENILLPDASVDFITSAQAFHWFDPVQSRKEFIRILRKGGYVFLIWNRRQDDSGLMRAYEKLLKDELKARYTSVHHARVTRETLHGFFRGSFETEEFENHQNLLQEEFLGRVFSSSYTPEPEESSYQPFRQKLIDLFEEYQEENRVRLIYRTVVYTGRFS